MIRKEKPVDWRRALESAPVTASAPCRVDVGGTLDIRTFSYPLGYLDPCTVNIALDLRTTVRLEPYRAGRVRVSSRGFPDAEYPAGEAPFRHPLGLMFAVAAFFQAEGVHIAVHSASPPRSALGGSSVAAVALVGAFMQAGRRPSVGRPAIDGRSVARVAHAIEESSAGVLCGFQDQLAAVFGGVNAWYWLAPPGRAMFRREALVPRREWQSIERRLLTAYVGVPHASVDINGRWVQQFLSGRFRREWADIIACTRSFADALRRRDYAAAGAAMNREMDLRRRMTPAVLDGLGRRLVAAARRCGCGARIAGAGGGGCLWAIGPDDAIARLKPVWEGILSARRDARLLVARVAGEGLAVSA